MQFGLHERLTVGDPARLLPMVVTASAPLGAASVNPATPVSNPTKRNLMLHSFPQVPCRGTIVAISGGGGNTECWLRFSLHRVKVRALARLDHA